MCSCKVFLLGVVIVLQCSCGYSLPKGYQTEGSITRTVIPLDGHKVRTMKIEVVFDNGNTSIEEVELEDYSSEESTSTSTTTTTTTTTPPSTSEEEEEYHDDEEDTKTNSNCNWRRLYRLYLKKRKMERRGLPEEKRFEIREAFKIVCDNPEDVIRLLLNMD